jgi:hypothetical protein
VADEQSPHDSELTPEQETVVRRLLSEARHDDGIPDTVAARLDRVLAQLSAETTDTDAPIVDLAARRRRQRAGRLLMAAAAIVVGGVAAGQVLGSSSDSGGADSSTPGAATFRSDSPTDDGAGQDAHEAAPEGADAAAPSNADQLLGKDLPLRLSRDSFDRDVRQLADQRNAALLDLGTASANQGYLLAAVPGFDCPPAAYGKGTLVPALYDDEPAVLAFRPPLGSNRVAELLQCGTAQKLRTVNLTR